MTKTEGAIMNSVRSRWVGEGDTGGVALFLILTVAISSIFYTLAIVSGHLGGGNGSYVAGLMWSPGLAAFASIAIRHLDAGSLGLSRWNGRAALIAYLVPLGYGAVAYALIWGLGLGGFAEPTAIAPLAEKLDWHFSTPLLFVPSFFVLSATTGMVRGIATALGEEIGWRGYLTPRLVARFGFTGGSLVGGLIWATWHLPVLLFADYNNATSWWFAMPCFYVLVIASAFMLTWLRLRADSVWPCAIMHASHNLFIKAIFTKLTSPRGTLTPYIIDEFGIAVPTVMVVVALIFWLRRDQAMSAV